MEIAHGSFSNMKNKQPAGPRRRQIETDRLDTEHSSTRLTGRTPDLYQTSALHSASSRFYISGYIYTTACNLVDEI